MLLKNFQRLFSGKSYTSVGFEEGPRCPEPAASFEPCGCHGPAVPPAAACLGGARSRLSALPSARTAPASGVEVGEARAERKTEKNPRERNELHLWSEARQPAVGWDGRQRWCADSQRGLCGSQVNGRCGSCRLRGQDATAHLSALLGSGQEL